MCTLTSSHVFVAIWYGLIAIEFLFSVLLFIVSVCTAVSAYFWLGDPETSQVSLVIHAALSSDTVSDSLSVCFMSVCLVRFLTVKILRRVLKLKNKRCLNSIKALVEQITLTQLFSAFDTSLCNGFSKDFVVCFLWIFFSWWKLCVNSSGVYCFGSCRWTYIIILFRRLPFSSRWWTIPCLQSVVPRW